MNTKYMIIALALGAMNVHNVKAITEGPKPQARFDDALRGIDEMATNIEVSLQDGTPIPNSLQWYLMQLLKPIREAVLAAVEHGAALTAGTQNELWKKLSFNHSINPASAKNAGTQAYLKSVAQKKNLSYVWIDNLVNEIVSYTANGSTPDVKKAYYDARVLQLIFSKQFDSSAALRAGIALQAKDAILAARIALGQDARPKKKFTQLSDLATSKIVGGAIDPMAQDCLYNYINPSCSSIADMGRAAIYNDNGTGFAHDLARAACAGFFCKFGHPYALRETFFKNKPSLNDTITDAFKKRNFSSTPLASYCDIAGTKTACGLPTDF